MKGPGKQSQGFTLLEVLIAMGIFFMAVFAVLHLTSQSMASARMLQRPPLDFNNVIIDIFMTNRVEEGLESGDFGDLFPGLTWSRNISEVSTNGLFQVDVTITERGRTRVAEHTASLLLFRPESSTGPINRLRR
jgi:general secretion pathway protein I